MTADDRLIVALDVPNALQGRTSTHLDRCRCLCVCERIKCVECKCLLCIVFCTIASSPFLAVIIDAWLLNVCTSVCARVMHFTCKICLSIILIDKIQEKSNPEVSTEAMLNPHVCLVDIMSS